MRDDMDEAVEFDATIGTDMIDCPHCGVSIQVSVVLDNNNECPHCGGNIKEDPDGDDETDDNAKEDGEE